MGLLKTPEDEEIPEENDENNVNKDVSPFKDLMATLEKPADLTAHPGTPVSLFQHHTNVISPPRSADYYSKKTTFFQVSCNTHWADLFLKSVISMIFPSQILM